MSKKVKILFLAPHFAGGGASRVLSTLISNLNKDNYDVHLGLQQKKGEYLNDINNLTIHEFKAKRTLYSIIPLLKLAKKLKPDIVFMSTPEYLMATQPFRLFFPKSIKFLYRETNIVSLRMENSKARKLLYYFCLKKASTIVCQSNDMLHDLMNLFKLPSSKVVKINNPINFPLIEVKTKIPPEITFDKKYKNIVFLGRLIKRKRIEDMLHAIAGSTQKSLIRFYLIGSGDQQQALLALVDKLNLSESVCFLGEMANPYHYLIQSDLLLLASKHEGMPNVVLEAMACGIPTVSYNCLGGLNELVFDNKTGFLAKNNDVTSLAQCIDKALTYPFNKQEITDFARQNFSEKKITKEYDALLQELIKQ